ncbi:MAG: hypothetical protein V3S16_12325 [Candidatus Desulfatibia sp.]|uniref:hypothetical protein n=1 Tax=Candidatus Desulfatibia sp. TaxID=3101189 RepID=UPI002F2ED4F0
MASILGKIKQRIGRLTGKMNQQQEAITFAEAGEPEHAQQLFQEQPEAQQPAKLLVVGRESSFSGEIIDYALEMSQRMSYGIIALNTAPLSCDTFKLFSSSRDELCKKFKSLSEENVGIFQQAAAEKGISFQHVIMYCETDEALEAVSKEFGEISFVVSESEEERVEDGTEDGEKLRRELVVYSIV